MKKLVSLTIILVAMAWLWPLSITAGLTTPVATAPSDISPPLAALEDTGVKFTLRNTDLKETVHIHVFWISHPYKFKGMAGVGGAALTPGKTYQCGGKDFRPGEYLITIQFEKEIYTPSSKSGGIQYKLSVEPSTVEVIIPPDPEKIEQLRAI